MFLTLRDLHQHIFQLQSTADMDYLESVRQELLKQLKNKEITEDEFWEYYNQESGDYNECQESSYLNRSKDYEH